jgi:uncharacterized protein (DUF305 family)
VNNPARRFTVLLIPVLVIALAAGRQDSLSHSIKSAREAPWSELAASMDKMHAAMASVGPSGEADIDFVRLMLPHHQAAIDMAKTELSYGKDPQMRRMAQEIITDQQSEIELMRMWLKQHESGSLQK